MTRLTAPDYIVIALYFSIVVGVGVYFARRERTTETYFLGNRRLPWWAVGLSIYATSLSAITYVSIPATAYAGDWTTMVFNCGTLFFAPFVALVYLPRLRQSPVTTGYEYLEQRFNVWARLYGSLVFFTFQLGRMSIVLYLPAMTLSTATGMDVYFSILAMGIVSTLYSAMGGIEAVIWTDVMQSVVLLFGAVLAIVLILVGIDGGPIDIAQTAYDAGKFHAFDWSWDVAAPVAWLAILGGVFANAYPMTGDQTVVQRYLSTATTKEATRAMWVNALMTLPMQLLFFGIGTALWVFFQQHPELLREGMQNDAILPLFVMERFPVGLKGLIIAGLFAASMSSLDSSMNSLSTVSVNDFYRRFVKNVPDGTALNVARVLTLMFGTFGTLTALYIATVEPITMFNLFIQLLSVVGSGLAGMFVLGVCVKRATGAGAVTGAATSGVLMCLIVPNTRSFVDRYVPFEIPFRVDVHSFGHAIIGFVTCFMVGWAASLVVGTSKARRA